MKIPRGDYQTNRPNCAASASGPSRSLRHSPQTHPATFPALFRARRSTRREAVRAASGAVDHPSSVRPNDHHTEQYNEVARTAMRLLAEASTTLARLKASRRL
jgi:hypothetical protein